MRERMQSWSPFCFIIWMFIQLPLVIECFKMLLDREGESLIHIVVIEIRAHFSRSLNNLIVKHQKSASSLHHYGETRDRFFPKYLGVRRDGGKRWPIQAGINHDSKGFPFKKKKAGSDMVLYLYYVGGRKKKTNKGVSTLIVLTRELFPFRLCFARVESWHHTNSSFSAKENIYITSCISFLDSIILLSESLIYSFLLPSLFNFEKKRVHLGTY